MGTKIGAISSELGGDIVEQALEVKDSKGNVFNIKYLISKITGKVQDDMRNASDNDNISNKEANALVLSLVTWWDLEYNDRDEPIALTDDEVNKHLSIGVALLIINAIMGDIKPKKKK